MTTPELQALATWLEEAAKLREIVISGEPEDERTDHNLATAAANLRAAARVVAAMAKLEGMRTGSSDTWYCQIDKHRRPELGACHPGGYKATALEAIEAAR